MNGDLIQHRDAAITAAHRAITAAIRHLDIAAVHAEALGDDVHVEHLADVMKRLADARQPLAEHIDWTQASQ